MRFGIGAKATPMKQKAPKRNEGYLWGPYLGALSRISLIAVILDQRQKAGLVWHTGDRS